MITGVLRLGDRSVRAVMTPRPDIVWLDPLKSDEENLTIIRESSHSRFPVAEGGIDQVVGIAQTKDLLVRCGLGQELGLRDVIHTPLVVPETMSVLRLLETMRESPVRMLLIADEYGTINGLITAADVLEAIAGDVALSAEDAIVPPVRRDDGSWLIDGMMPIDEFERLLEAPGLADEGAIDTVAGLVIALIERLPKPGDKTERWPLSFEVVDMDGRRIDKVIVRRHAG
jgi:putative hemolysin